MDNKSKLIEQIMTEVKDPELRDKLLNSVADAKNTNGSAPKKNDSLILNELEQFGFDKEATKGYVKTQIKLTLIMGWILVIIVGLIGLAITIAGLYVVGIVMTVIPIIIAYNMLRFKKTIKQAA